jgi:hypothetical protein
MILVLRQTICCSKVSPWLIKAKPFSKKKELGSEPTTLPTELPKQLSWLNPYSKAGKANLIKLSLDIEEQAGVMKPLKTPNSKSWLIIL